MYCLYVVLINTQTVIAKSVKIIKNDEVTHAAIALDKDLQTLCGFGRKWALMPFIGGFREESYSQGYYAFFNTIPGFVMEIKVTKKQYEKASRMLAHFAKNSQYYRYNILGLLGNIVDIPVYNERRFICSEFVAHVLQECGAVQFDKPLSLVRPQMLATIPGRLIYKGNLKRYTA